MRLQAILCVLSEMLAAYTQVNLLAFTSKLHVRQINCMWGLYICGLEVKLPQFAGHFTRASFTVRFLNILRLVAKKS